MRPGGGLVDVIADELMLPALAGVAQTPALSEAVRLGINPRERGEHVMWRDSAQADFGSPPRAGGALIFPPGPVASTGITPASAGSTAVSVARIARVRDHPPRARGARRRPAHRPVGGGITPASAGSTFGVPCVMETVWDHPRERGEHEPQRISLRWVLALGLEWFCGRGCRTVESEGLR